MEFNIVSTESKECVICLEELYINHKITEKANSIQTFKSIYKQCPCEYTIHTNCFDEWISVTPACPICHLETYRIDEIYITPIPNAVTVTVTRPNTNRHNSEHSCCCICCIIGSLITIVTCIITSL